MVTHEKAVEACQRLRKAADPADWIFGAGDQLPGSQHDFILLGMVSSQQKERPATGNLNSFILLTKNEIFFQS